MWLQLERARARQQGRWQQLREWALAQGCAVVGAEHDVESVAVAEPRDRGGGGPEHAHSLGPPRELRGALRHVLGSRFLDGVATHQREP